MAKFYDPLLQELYEAGLRLRPFLKASTDEYVFSTSNKTQAERLRAEADEIEARDAAINSFRSALDAMKNGTATG